MEDSKTGAKKWTIKNVTGTKTTIKDIKPGKKYQFKVAAIKKTGKIKKTGPYSRVIYRYCEIFKNYKCAGRKKAIKVSWNKMKGISGCRILVSRNRNLKKAKIFMINSPKTSYIVKGLESGKTYYIGIKPYKRNGGKDYLGILKKKAVKIR